MPYVAPLLRRIANPRAIFALGLGLSLSACQNIDDLGPSVENAPAPSFATAAYTKATTGIPFGAFGLLRTQYTVATWSGSLEHLSPGSSALSTLAAARNAGVRMVISLAGGRSNYKNADGTFNLTKWKARVAQWKTVNIAPYINSGTIIGHFLVDEPSWPGSWGGQAIAPSVLEEMARYSKSIWPSMATTVRVTPSYLRGRTWNYLDFAWAQWEGPLHSPSTHLTPEQFRDQQIADAKAAGVGLMFGMNFLDGGDGSSHISGTYKLTTTKNRWQMSATEVERVGRVLAGASYACGVVSWQWSTDYPAYSSLTLSQLSGIRNFNRRSDVQTALSHVASVARNRSTSTCRR